LSQRFEKSSDVAASTYKFERTLKRTLCGTIKLATDVRRKRPVAIKLSSRKQLSELTLGNCAENPQEEMRIMTKLRDSPLDGHQFVIQLLNTYTLQKGSDTIDCTVLEFADGGEFFEHIQSLAQQGGRMDLNSVLNAFSMIAKGVRFIHKNGIVHLDLSLENILLTKQNILKICDFGLAREGRIFKLFTVPGKFPYMAPEVFAKKEFDGQKADVWSLGVILWCLLTSLALYEIPADSDARFHRLRSGKQGIKEILTAFQVHGIPEVVIDLLSGMLNVNPSQRLSIQEVLDHPWLRPLASLSPSIPTVDSSVTTTDMKAPTPQTIIIDESVPSSSMTTSTSTYTSKRPIYYDQKVIYPPIDDTWSTYHRLYDQFEEKYGKMILAQQHSYSSSQGCSSHLNSDNKSPSVMMETSFPTTPCSPSSSSPTSSDPSWSPTWNSSSTTRRSSNQVGWKRKHGFTERVRRPPSPPRFALHEP